jgi:poly(3-hydroxyoctanoate) depolymerase
LTDEPRRARVTFPRIRGVRTHVRDVGEGPAVLLINGLGAHTRMWHNLEERLVGHRVVAFDAPGTGESQTPPTPLTIPVLARFATDVLDHVGVGRADVLGYSMGGVVAQQLAIQSPERVRRLVLVATSVGLGTVPGNLRVMLSIATPLRYKSPWVYRRTIAGLVGGRARTDPRWVEEHGEIRLSRAPTMRGYVSQLAGMTWSTLPWLGRVEHPALVVVGDDDPLIPVANALLLTNRLRHARGVVVEGEGHLMLMDEDSAAFEPITEFLGAARHEDASAWRRGFVADDAQLEAAIRATRGQAQPWGVSGAFLRAVFRSRADATGRTQSG